MKHRVTTRATRTIIDGTGCIRLCKMESLRNGNAINHRCPAALKLRSAVKYRLLCASRGCYKHCALYVDDILRRIVSLVDRQPDIRMDSTIFKRPCIYRRVINGTDISIFLLRFWPFVFATFDAEGIYLETGRWVRHCTTDNLFGIIGTRIRFSGKQFLI